jgi:CubicO group peptidase (beta-lactamase class C family)
MMISGIKNCKLLKLVVYMKRRIFAAFLFSITLVTLLVAGYPEIFGAGTHDSLLTDNSGFIAALKADPGLDLRIKSSGGGFASWLNSNTGGSLVPAASAGIVLGDELIYHTGANASAGTRFGIASLTKTFTALLALILAEEGVLSLDDPVTKYLPEVKIERDELKSAPVTLRHLLAHTSGISSYGKSVTYTINGKRVSVPVQVNPAGYCYAYSNPGYELMQYVIEAAAGKPYAACMKEKVFIPLDMKNSSAEHSNATGGIQSNIYDLANYAAMLIGEGSFRGRTILTKQSFLALVSPGVDLPGVDVDYYYSLGWEVMTSGRKVDSYYKAGRWFGQASGVQVFPQKGIAYIYLCNPPQHLNDSFMEWRQRLTGNLRTLVRNISADRSLGSRWPSLKPSELKWYEGEYRKLMTGEKVRVFFRGGTLYSDRYGVMPLRTFTSNRMLIDSGSMLHNFVWRDNRVIGLSLRDGFYERAAGSGHSGGR